MLGERLGNWVISKELGRGGMGRVYLAQEELGGRQAAVKVLAVELAQDAGFLHRFQREIEALRRLDHPHIVKFYEAGCEHGQYYYAMEYLDGQSLEDVLHAQGRLPWQEVLDIAAQLCPALKHAHDHGIIHRDLKPPNLLRTPAGVVKLTDFGIAKVFAGMHLTATGGVVGTAEYLSPEQAAGKPATKRSDLYSLGVVLYTLLTGRTPFEGKTHLELLHKHCYAQFDRPQKLVALLPYEVDELVCQLLEKDPAARPADALVLGRQVDSIRRKLERKGRLTDPGPPQEATVAENQLPAAGFGPGPATMMSRLMREELARQNQPGGVSRLVNRVWVLLPALLLCVSGIVWAFWPASAATLFRQGAELMAQDDPAAWAQAWQEYFQPLNERYPDHPYQDDVARFRRQIDTARQPNEARRLYLEGKRLLAEGQPAAAGRLWKSLITVFEGIDSAQPWVARARNDLTELDHPPQDAERLAQVRAALERANALRDQGKRQEAERIWDAIENLYRDDPAARDLLTDVHKARQAR
jgi:serine/threonine-protein kinase